jgi:hypothetical protein
LFPMKRVLLLFLTVMISCGNAPDTTEDIDQASQAATTHYTVNDGSIALPNTSTKFCRLTGSTSKGGHWSASQWPNTAYKNGSVIVGEPPSLLAKVYGPAAMPPTRMAGATAACSDYSTFLFGPNAFHSLPQHNLNFIWSTAVGQNFVTDDKPLWDLGSICYVNGFDSMSHTNEEILVYPYIPDNRWYFRASGYSKLSAFAKCVYPNRSFTSHGPYELTATGVVQGPTVTARSFCAFTKLKGNMDDTYAYIYQENGYWKLTAEFFNPGWYGGDGDHAIAMTCWKFP